MSIKIPTFSIIIKMQHKHKKTYVIKCLQKDKNKVIEYPFADFNS